MRAAQRWLCVGMAVLALAARSAGQACATNNGGCLDGGCTDDGNGGRTCACSRGFQPNAATGNCEPCPGGTFSATESSEPCTPHTVCGAGQLIVVEGTDTTDRLCADECPAGQYVFVQAVFDFSTGMVTTETTCRACRACAPGTHYAEECGGLTNPTCVACTTAASCTSQEYLVGECVTNSSQGPRCLERGTRYHIIDQTRKLRSKKKGEKEVKDSGKRTESRRKNAS